MRGFLQIMLVLAILLLALGASFLVLDVVSLGEFRTILQKSLIVLAIFTGAGLVASLLTKPNQ